jgi:hypothetical protein
VTDRVGDDLLDLGFGVAQRLERGGTDWLMILK